VDVPTPEVRILESPRPESFTLGSGETAVITVSRGMIDALTRAELEAVMAHEISHLVNGDSRLLTAALTPVLIADKLIEEDPHDFGDELSNGWFRAWKRYGQFGVAVLSCEREWSADAGAAALTGSPATLASALETLAERRGRPTTDLREWEGLVAAMDILPTTDPSLDAGPFRTHPPTEDRIAALRRRVRAEAGLDAV